MNFLAGQKLVKQKEFGKALDIFLNLKQSTTKDIRVFFYLGIIYFELNEFNKSIFFYEKYLKEKPNAENALYNLAIVRQSIGDLKIAKQIYLKLINLNNSSLRPYLGLLTLDENFLTEENYKNIYSIVKTRNLSIYDKGIINFILSKKEKKNKNYSKEIKYLQKFHQNIFNSNYDYNKSSQFYYEKIIKEKYDKIEFINNIENNFEKKQWHPIFIVGLPRSGSTLIESILTSGLDKIYSCGESHIINMSILEQIGPIINSKNFDITNFEFKIDMGNFQNSVLNKYSKYNPIKKFENKIFLDKSLENFLNIDIILKLFPEAKFLHTHRNITDSIISIYQSMLPELSWTHKINDIMSYIDSYKNIILYFKSKYPENIIDIELEEFTNKNEQITKKIYKFCNLKWSEDVLKFYKRDDLSSKTLSFVQIRKKISKYDKNKYQPYSYLLNDFKKKFKWIDKN